MLVSVWLVVRVAGRVGVVGGSFEYTGAPYYAGISSLKTVRALVLPSQRCC